MRKPFCFVIILFFLIGNPFAHSLVVPEVWFHLKFVDVNGKPIKKGSGLVVSAEVDGRWKEVNIESQVTIVKIPFLKNYAGSLKIKIYDSKNETKGRKSELSFFNSEQEKKNEILYTFYHYSGAGYSQNKSKSYYSNTRFLNNNGTFVEKIELVQPIRLDYKPIQVQKLEKDF